MGFAILGSGTTCLAAKKLNRQFIGGCLCESNAFKGICDSKNFPVSMKAHECGFYIGLNKKITVKMAKQLAQELSKL